MFIFTQQCVVSVIAYECRTDSVQDNTKVMLMLCREITERHKKPSVLYTNALGENQKQTLGLKYKISFLGFTL